MFKFVHKNCMINCTFDRSTNTAKVKPLLSKFRYGQFSRIFSSEAILIWVSKFINSELVECLSIKFFFMHGDFLYAW